MDDDGGFGGGLGIDDVSKGLETTTEAESIRGQRRRLRHHDDRPEELVTTVGNKLKQTEDRKTFVISNIVFIVSSPSKKSY